MRNPLLLVVIAMLLIGSVMAPDQSRSLSSQNQIAKIDWKIGGSPV